MSMNSQVPSQMGTPRGGVPQSPGGGAKPPQQASMINNARRFSIYIKNVP